MSGPSPAALLARLDAIGESLACRSDAVALIGLGSVGLDTNRLDEHSDLDFFVIVDDGAKVRFLASIDWLESAHPVTYSFENTVDGRKALFADGIFAEYAVFTVPELEGIPYAPGRIVWRRWDAPEGIESPPPRRSPHETVDFTANEILTNLYVGLHREARGERLAAFRLIQVSAVDRAIELQALMRSDLPPAQDPFAPERGVEHRFGLDELPLATLTPGYEANREAALAMLDWLTERFEPNATLAAEIRRLAGH